jgi:hypothetical protein
VDGHINRAALGAVAEQVRAVLAGVDAGELSCSRAYRNRLQGAAVALEALARGQADTAALLESVAGESSTR